MKIPKKLFGTGKEVHAPTTRWMAKVKKRMEWLEIAEEDMVDTKLVAPPGSDIQVMFDLYVTQGGNKAFRLYAPFRYFKFHLGEDRSIFWAENNLLFDALVESSWGLLSLLVTGAFIPRLEMDPVRNLHFFERLVEDWDLFLAEAHLFEKYDYGGFMVGKYFWCSEHTTLFGKMAKSGVPKEVIDSIPLKERDEYQPVRWIKEYILK